MIIDLARLLNNIDDYIEIDMTQVISNSYLTSTEIQKLSDILVHGFIKKDIMDEVIIDVNIIGVMTLPCALTLEPVDYKFNIKVEGNLYEMLDEIGENVKNNGNSIDILPIVWENILMEIPMKVVSPKSNQAKLEGNGWKVVTDMENEPDL